MKDKLGMLVLVRGITGFTVRVVGVVIVGLLSRLAVLATWAKEGELEDLNTSRKKNWSTF